MRRDHEIKTAAALYRCKFQPSAENNARKIPRIIYRDEPAFKHKSIPMTQI